MEWEELIKIVGATLAVLTSAVGLVAAIERYSGTARAKKVIEWASKALEREPSGTRSRALKKIIVYSEAHLFAASLFPSGALALIVCAGIAIAVFGLTPSIVTFSILSESATVIISSLIILGVLPFGVGRWWILHYSRQILIKAYQGEMYFSNNCIGVIGQKVKRSWLTYAYALMLSLGIAVLFSGLVLLTDIVISWLAGYPLLSLKYIGIAAFGIIVGILGTTLSIKQLKYYVKSDFNM